MKAALPGAVALLASGLWLAWPWLVPIVSPVPTTTAGSDLVVVLDGGSGRFAAADGIGQALSQPPRRLLIRCPRGTPPPQPTAELLQGFDTATQITALAHWLRHQPPPRSARVWDCHRSRSHRPRRSACPHCPWQPGHSRWPG